VLFTVSKGRRWTEIDYGVVGGKKKRVELGSWTAEGRAFVPDGWTGVVMLHPFGHVAYHDTEPRTLEGRLDFAKPVGASVPKSFIVRRAVAWLAGLGVS
jgi:hypothetical protein